MTAGSRRSRAQKNLRAAVFVENFVGKRRAAQRDGHHCVARTFATLANGISDFACLAEANADTALFVANDDQGTETETTSAFTTLEERLMKTTFSINSFNGLPSLPSS